MPYIKQDDRVKLQSAINALICEINAMSDYDSRKGNTNYAITSVLLGVFPDLRYHEINDAMGVLACVQAEFYRRQAAPYEDKKAIENGDVF